MKKTSESRLAQIVEEFGPGCNDREACIDSCQGKRFILIESSTHDGSYWLSGHDSLEEAAQYRDGAEYPHDYSVEALVDLTTGEEFTTKTTWVTVRRPRSKA